MARLLTDILVPYQERIERELRGLTPFTDITTLHDPIVYFFALPGKRIRPLITLMTAENFYHHYEQAVPAAVAIEVLHDFTLVHDDIMDEDRFRRGHATVHTKWDVGTAILAGDAMVALAYRKLLTVKSPHLIAMIEAFTDGMYVVCAGQARDKSFETRGDVTVDDYLSMISEKTARLIALAFELGYLSGADDTELLTDLKVMGEHIGLAFQVKDDILDFMADEKTLGKDIGSDWRRKKKTYITIGYHQKAAMNPQFPRDLFALPEFSKAKAVVEQAGVLRDAQNFIEDRLQRAREIAAAINFTHPVFSHLLQFLAERNY
jgi:geranylgeranyl diphosphate synthase type II